MTIHHIDVLSLRTDFLFFAIVASFFCVRALNHFFTFKKKYVIKHAYVVLIIMVMHALYMIMGPISVDPRS